MQVFQDGTSLITTNISTITIDDKENRDPVTGLPLSSLLIQGKGGKGKGKRASSTAPNPFASGQKFIATTITTTVLSAVPISFPTSTTSSDGTPMSPTPAAKAPTRKTRVALGLVTRGNGNADVEDASSKAEKPVKRVSGPRRSLRLAEIAENAVLETPVSSPPASAKTSKAKAPKPSTKGKALRAASTSTTSAAGAGVSSQAKAKKLALARHSAAVAAAADAVSEDVQNPSETGSLGSGSPGTERGSVVVMHVSPVKKRTSPRRSGVKAEEVFLDGRSPKLHQLSSSARSRIFQGTEGLQPTGAGADVVTDAEFDTMDLDVQFADPDAARATAACVQRIIDQRCKELTVLPLGDISGGFMNNDEGLSQEALF